jgi:uncharacterized protein
MIDFHQHIDHFGRSVEHLLRHQDVHGVAQSVVLPIDGTSTPAERWPTETALEAAQQYPDRLIAFCHVDPRRSDALEAIRRYRARGAAGFGEQKVRIAVDAPEAQAIYRLCAELQMPVLLHLEYGAYNFNFEALGGMVERHPHTVFIGHGPAWWANIGAAPPRDPAAPDFASRPGGPVAPGGLTDRWLGQYPNLYADLSAGSGLNALQRDQAFAREFIARHQHKLLWATDCPCRDGAGDWGDVGLQECFAAWSLPLLRALCPGPEVLDRITRLNARSVLGLPDRSGADHRAAAPAPAATAPAR